MISHKQVCILNEKAKSCMPVFVGPAVSPLWSREGENVDFVGWQIPPSGQETVWRRVERGFLALNFKRIFCRCSLGDEKTEEEVCGASPNTVSPNLIEVAPQVSFISAANNKTAPEKRSGPLSPAYQQSFRTAKSHPFFSPITNDLFLFHKTPEHLIAASSPLPSPAVLLEKMSQPPPPISPRPP